MLLAKDSDKSYNYYENLDNSQQDEYNIVLKANKGVIEEIEIARENNIPVFLVGMVGGKSSQIAAKYLKNKNWAELNNAPIELNEELALSLDYRTVFKKLIDNIVSYGE